MCTDLDLEMMKNAVALSKQCPVSMNAYSVGAIIIDENNNIISTGYSRETADNVHAEEVAINKANTLGKNLQNATIYSTMEPCGLRLSGKLCCADRIIDSGIKRVVYSIKEPPNFVENATGIDKLMLHGIHVTQIEDFIDDINEINKHIYENQNGSR